MSDPAADHSAAMTTKNKQCTSKLRESLDPREKCRIETASFGQNLHHPSAVAEGRSDKSFNCPMEHTQNVTKGRSNDNHVD